MVPTPFLVFFMVRRKMNETTIFIILFSSMIFTHELGHVAYAKWTRIYKCVTAFRLYHLSEKIPQRGLWKFPLGVGVETDLNEETLHQRIFNCLSGVLAGLPFLIVAWFMLSGFNTTALVGAYLGSYCIDLVTVFQIAIIGRKEGWDLKLAEVI